MTLGVGLGVGVVARFVGDSIAIAVWCNSCRRITSVVLVLIVICCLLLLA